MYYGEVNVAQEELNSFLAVAEDLQVKGLTQDSSTDASRNRQSPHLNPIIIQSFQIIHIQLKNKCLPVHLNRY